MLVEFPRAVRQLGILRPLLIHKRAGIREHAVIPLWVVPRHDQRARSAGAVAGGGAAIGIVRQLDVGLFRDARQHFLLHPLRIQARHGVVLESALAALSVARAVLDGDRDHRGHFVLGNQVVEDGEQQLVRPIGADDEGCFGTWLVLLRDIDRDPAHPRRRMARGDNQLARIVGVGSTERVFIARDAGVDSAVLRVHLEVDDRALRHSFVHRGLGRGIVRGADDEVAVGRRRGQFAVRQFLGIDVSGSVRIARGRRGPLRH